MKNLRIRATAVVVLLLITAALTGWGVWKRLEGRKIDVKPSFVAAEEVIETTKQSTEAILTYRYDSVEEDVSAAEKLTTGKFRDDYRRFAQTTVIPNARVKQVSNTASVVGAGIETLSTDSATVMLFINQSTTSAAEPIAKLSTTSTRVTVDKVGGRWLISQLNPL